MKPISEAEFQSQVIAVARLYGWKVAHFRPARVTRRGKETYRTAMTGHSGYVDLTLARNGDVIHAELKTSAGKLSAEQQEWQQALGKTAVVWRPEDWDLINSRLANWKHA